MPTKAFEAFCTIWRNSVMENICNSKARFPFLSVPVEAECLITLMSAFSMGKILEWKKNGKRIPRLVVLSSIQFRFSVMSNYLRPHELQQARPPYPSPTPRVHPNPCPLRRPGFNSCVGKIPWRRKWQSTPVFLLGKIPWTEEPGGSIGLQEVDTT